MQGVQIMHNSKLTQLITDFGVDAVGLVEVLIEAQHIERKAQNYELAYNMLCKRLGLEHDEVFNQAVQQINKDWIDSGKVL
jgi:hypothetical protein